MSAPRIYMYMVSHLSAKKYQNCWKFDEVLTKHKSAYSFFGTRCKFLNAMLQRKSIKIPYSDHVTKEEMLESVYQ